MKTILRILERAGDYRPTLYLKIDNPQSGGFDNSKHISGSRIRSPFCSP